MGVVPVQYVRLETLARHKSSLLARPSGVGVLQQGGNQFQGSSNSRISALPKMWVSIPLPEPTPTTD